MAKRTQRGDGLVYSTDPERMRAPAPSASPTAAGAQQVRVRRESKGRGGKTVTTVSGLRLDAFAMAELARELKQACGAGGTVKDDVIEIQGDRVDRVLSLLLERGYAAKRAGG